MIRSCTRSRLIANHLNVLASAVISATAQRPSDAIRLLESTPGGSGSLHLAGPFTGAVDGEVEAEIISLAGGTVVAGTPVTHGVGSGALSVTALRAGATAETLELTLLDAGEPSKSATYDFFGYEIAARVPGIAGNSLRIEVERRLALTPTSHSAIERIATGTTELVGPIWEWGQPAGQGATVPPDALRIQFEGHPTVHRAWRQWRNNQWVYRLDPAPAFDVLPDTRILAVTGDYRLTLTDGVTTEVFDVVTIHDFLSALDARSSLVEVRAPLSRDRTAGGMSVLDVPLRSDAHALPAIVNSRADARINVGPILGSANTENITFRYSGGGLWSVSGAVSGRMPSARSGEPYRAVPFVGAVITQSPAPASELAQISTTTVFATRTDNEGLPALCFKPLRLGAQARDREVTFVYTRRPPSECSCAGMPALAVNDSCLGLSPEGGDMALDAEFQARLTALYAWQADFISSQIALYRRLSAAFSAPNVLTGDRADVEVARGATKILAEALAEIYSEGVAAAQWDSYFATLQASLAAYEGTIQSSSEAGVMATTWSAALKLESGQYVRPTSPSGRLYMVTTAGETGPSEPDWASAGVTVADGTAVLEAQSPYWTANTPVSVGRTISPGNGKRFIVETSGTTGATEPYWPSAEGATVTDGGVVWEDKLSGSADQRFAGTDVRAFVGPAFVKSSFRGPSSSSASAGCRFSVYVDGVMAFSSDQFLGSSSAGADAFESAKNAAMAEAEKRAQSAADVFVSNLLSLINGGTEAFMNSLRAQMDHVRTLAGIVPKSDAGSGGANPCWRDHGGTHWWVDEGGRYLPAFTNQPYVSAIRLPDGDITSTEEFGFGLITACPERLKEGDKFTLHITGTANAAEFGEGDTITVPIVAGTAAFFSYGAGGQPVQTWTVRGSVSGALPDWLRDLDAPAPYTAAASPAELELADGGIPFEAGDRIRVDIFGGRLRWRRDGGAWGEADIFADHDAGDGLTLSARVGSAPAFAVGNRWRFAAEARYGVSKLRQPRPGEAFAWDGDSVTLTASWHTPVEAEVLAVALADLPPGAVLTLTVTDAAAVVTTTTATVTDGVALFRLGTQVQLAEARLSITHAGAGGAIGWLFAGMGWRPTVGASTLSRSRQYGLTRGARAGSGALYSGRGVGGEWSWQVSDGGVLLDDTCRSLQTLLDHVATHDNEPILLVPDLNDPTLASVAVLAADEIRFDDELGWQGGEQWRHVSVSLPFDAVLEAA